MNRRWKPKAVAATIFTAAYLVLVLISMYAAFFTDTNTETGITAMTISLFGTVIGAGLTGYCMNIYNPKNKRKESVICRIRRSLLKR